MSRPKYWKPSPDTEELNPEIVSLLIDGTTYKVAKHVLCEYSDYFSAMFSGNFSEGEKTEICIDVVDSNSMNIIVRYMQLGLIDLGEYSLATIGELARSANFLQITELIKQIEYYLEIQLSALNWVEIMTIAENASFLKLQQHAAAFGLLEYKYVKPEVIPSLHKLVWYLSHTHINAESELQIFKFGHDWVVHNEYGADALLGVIGCLDMTRITIGELNTMKSLTKNYVNSLAEKVIECLYMLAQHFEISVMKIKNSKTELCELFTERVYTEVLNLVTASPKRELKFTPCLAMWDGERDSNKPEIHGNYLYQYKDQKLTQWVEVAKKDFWGWNIVAWGATKFVIVCGEHGRGNGYFWRGVKVYDTIKNEWLEHGVELPFRRHGAVAIVDDSLYIIGGVGRYRALLDNAIVYDLKKHTYREIAQFPNAMQAPALCIFEKKLYGSAQTNVYRYDDYGRNDAWVTILEINIRLTNMAEYKGYIYCMQNYFNEFYRFRPNVDSKLELVTTFSNPPKHICNIGNKLLVFTNSHCAGARSDTITVEEYQETNNGGQVTTAWSQDNFLFTVNDAAGCIAIVDSLPPIKSEISQYMKRCVASYEAVYAK